MATSTKVLPLFLLLIFLFSSLKVHARESQFFSKWAYNGRNNNFNQEESSNTPTTEQVSQQKETPLHMQNNEQKSSPTVDTENGYGLYGHGSEQLPPTTTTTTTTTPTTNDDNEVTDNTFSDLSSEFEETPTDEYKSGTYVPEEFNTRSPYNNNNNNGYYGASLSDTRFAENGQNNNNNWYQSQKQGMSDTRYLENGRYHYDVNNEKYNNRNEYQQYGRGRNEGFESFAAMDSRNQHEYNNNYFKNGRGGYNGVNENSFEHSNSYNLNSMEGNNNNNYNKHGRGGYNGVNENSFEQSNSYNSNSMGRNYNNMEQDHHVQGEFLP